MKNYYFGGINASGKSTLIDAIVAKDQKFVAVHTTKELMKWLGIENNYEALRAMNQDEVLKKYALFVDEWLESHKDKSSLFDSQFLNLVRGEYLDRTGDWIQKFDSIVVVNASLQDVLRRINSEVRDRALFDKKTISDDQKIKVLKEYSLHTEKLAQQTANKFKLECWIINNIDGKLDQAVEEFFELCG